MHPFAQDPPETGALRCVGAAVVFMRNEIGKTVGYDVIPAALTPLRTRKTMGGGGETENTFRPLQDSQEGPR